MTIALHIVAAILWALAIISAVAWGSASEAGDRRGGMILMIFSLSIGSLAFWIQVFA